MTKRCRDDDDATSGAVAMGDDSRGYDPHHHGEDDIGVDLDVDEELVQRRREIACHVLLSLSLSSWSSSSSSSSSCNNRIQADQQAYGTAPPPVNRGRRRRQGKDDDQVHVCTMCGLGFSTGQALGGHMRKHRMGRDDDMACFPSAHVDLKQIIVHGRPTSASSSPQLLNLFV